MAIRDSIMNALEPKGGLDGLKTILGAALVVAAGQLGILQDLLPMFDDTTLLEQAMTWLDKIIGFLEVLLEVVGNGFIGFGLWGKLRKLLGF